MYHDLLRSAEFWSFRFEIDQDLAETTRQEGCSVSHRHTSMVTLRFLSRLFEFLVQP
jgi:hypothetical protein